MPRTKRVILDGACYHIISRGNEQRQVFLSEDNYDKYMKILKKYKKRYGFKLYAWCLMKNHVHLIIQCKALSEAMHDINMCYAQYFQTLNGNVGHFWQDRFKSYVVVHDQYFITCLSYIEYNPVRAGIVRNPADYLWSSYRSRVLGKDKYRLLDFLAF